MYKNPLVILVALLMTNGCANSDDGTTRSLFDFDQPGVDTAWVAVNDGVMGGLSQGGPDFKDGVLNFSGQLSLENNGGFSSVRHDADLDLTGFAGLRLRVKGDGRNYQLRFQTDSRFRGRPVSYSAEFNTEKGVWNEVVVPFDALQAGFRGRSLSDYTFDPAKIQGITLMLADKNPGSFSLDVKWIEAYR